MKNLFILIFLLLSINVYSQNDPAKYLKSFFNEYAPCGKPIYCYQYDFEVEDKILVITTKLYNYDRSTKVEVLTEETIFKIPVNKIKSIDFYPRNGPEIFILTYNPDIEKYKNNEHEQIDLFLIDFDKHKLNNEKKMELKLNFESLLSLLK